MFDGRIGKFNNEEDNSYIEKENCTVESGINIYNMIMEKDIENKR